MEAGGIHPCDGSGRHADHGVHEAVNPCEVVERRLGSRQAMRREQRRQRLGDRCQVRREQVEEALRPDRVGDRRDDGTLDGRRPDVDSGGFEPHQAYRQWDRVWTTQRG